VPYVLGIDVGSQSVKGLLLDPDGRPCGSAAHPLSLRHPQGGWAEQDPIDWDTAVGAVVAGALAAAGVTATEVGALCLACQVDGVVAVGADGTALGPAIIWLDRRAEDQAARLAETVGAAELFETTGLVPDASHTGPKLMWLHDHEPELFARASAFLPASGYLLGRLTGEVAIDHANASSSLLYDLRTRAWSRPLLQAAGVDASRLGEIRESTDVVGHVTKSAAQRYGLATTCQVLVGTGDEHAASVGAGAVTPGVITDVTGTAEAVTISSDGVVLDHGGLVETHAHAIPGRYLVENPGFVSGGSTKWLADEVLRVTQSAVFESAARSTAGAGGVLFLPALSGAMTPRWNGRMRGAFAGLDLSHSSDDLCRAVLEGCCYGLRDVLERFATMGLGESEVRVVGGGAASAVWMQIKADVSGRPVRGVLVDEATALGAAMLAGVAVGTFASFSDAADRAVALAPEPFTPEPANARLYDEAYGRYCRLFDEVESVTT